MFIEYPLTGNTPSHEIKNFDAQLKLKNSDGSFQAELLFIIQAGQIDLAEWAMQELTAALNTTHQLIVTAEKIKLIAHPVQVQIRKNEILSSLNGTDQKSIGRLKIETQIGVKTKLNIPLTGQDEFSLKMTKNSFSTIEFRVLKNGKPRYPIYPIKDFSVVVSLYSETKKNVTEDNPADSDNSQQQGM